MAQAVEEKETLGHSCYELQKNKLVEIQTPLATKAIQENGNNCIK